MALPASAAADVLPSSYRSDAAQAGSTASLPSSDRSDAAQASSTASLPSSDRSDAAQSGLQAAEETGAQLAYPPADFRGGDSPVDHPGASRAAATPTTIEIVRPERTIVRDVDEALPLILSSAALLLVLAGFGITLMRSRAHARAGASV